ncbi:hypothetical protein V493_07601 [Pseudogymnoascus sp. VKM F-4281 (FW-2241)]|nr:hypothetical protein V493_07601 [Pseudogymnoascus sp. VKM F-4281 (FW-2241)]
MPRPHTAVSTSAAATGGFTAVAPPPPLPISRAQQQQYPMEEIETPPTPTLMSPLVGDFGIQPFAEVFAADPGMERLQQAPGFRKKKSAVFVKGGAVGGTAGGVEVGVGKDKGLPPLPHVAGDGERERGFIHVGDFTGLGGERAVDPRSPGIGSWGEGVVRSIDDIL